MDDRLVDPDLSDVLAARLRIAAHLHPTPLFTYPALDRVVGAHVYVKHEPPARRAFKVRGGVNLVAQLSNEERERGLIAASTGNHGQSVAFAARRFGVTARICIPERSNPVKVASMKDLGAELIVGGADFERPLIGHTRGRRDEVAICTGSCVLHVGRERNRDRLDSGVVHRRSGKSAKPGISRGGRPGSRTGSNR